MSDLTQKTGDRINNVTPTGQPMKRVTSAAQAHGLFRRLVEHNRTTAKDRAKIQGLIDGNAPYSEAELKRLGQSWRCNVNFREAEAEVDKTVNMYWQLIMEVPSLISIRIKPSVLRKKGVNPDLAVDWQSIMEEEFTEILRDEPSFFYNVTLQASEMIKYGLGPVMFTDQDDWRFESVKNASCLIPAKTKSTSDKNQFVCVRGEMGLDEIFDLLGSPEVREVATQKGWKLDNLRQAVIDSLNKGQLSNIGSRSSQKYQLSDWEDVQQAYKNGLITYSESDFDGLRVVHQFAKEASGKVTHLIIQEDNTPPSENAFLFESFERYESMERVIHLFFFSIGDGYFKSVKGLGHKIYASKELSNRYTCTAFDGGMMAASLVLEPSSGGEKKAVKLLRVGPVTVLPKGYSAIQRSFTPNFQHLIAMKGLLKQIDNNNVGSFDARGATVGDDVEKTLGQVQIEAANESRFSRNQVAIYYVQWRRLLKEMYRRLVNKDYNELSPGYSQHKEFVSNCVDRGVPRWALDCKNLRIKPVKAIGLGSAALEQMVMDKLYGQRGSYDEQGRNNVTRDWISANAGYDAVDRYAAKANRDLVPDSEASFAQLENNDFIEGKPVDVGVNQEHKIHLLAHIKPMVELVQVYEQQPQALNVPQAITAIRVGIPHSARHLELFARDPSRAQEVEQFRTALQDINKILKKMEKDLQKQQQEAIKQAQKEAEVNQNQLSEETLVELKKIENTQQLAILKEQNLNAVREMKAAHSMALKSAQAAQKASLEAQKTEG